MKETEKELRERIFRSIDRSMASIDKDMTHIDRIELENEKVSKRPRSILEDPSKLNPK